MSCIDVLLLQDPGGAQIGFLLGSLGVTVALSSEMTTKTLPKEENKDHIVHFRGENLHLVCVSVCLSVAFVCVSVVCVSVSVSLHRVSVW